MTYFLLSIILSSLILKYLQTADITPPLTTCSTDETVGLISGCQKGMLPFTYSVVCACKPTHFSLCACSLLQWWRVSIVNIFAAETDTENTNKHYWNVS